LELRKTIFKASDGQVFKLRLTQEFMGTLCVGDQCTEVKDGEKIKVAAEQLGIPFSCEEGVCGSCFCNVLEGEDNLMDLSEREEEYGLSGKNQRLACQAKMKAGKVKIESGY
jgi:ferredoxin